MEGRSRGTCLEEVLAISEGRLSLPPPRGEESQTAPPAQPDSLSWALFSGTPQGHPEARPGRCRGPMAPVQWVRRQPSVPPEPHPEFQLLLLHELFNSCVPRPTASYSCLLHSLRSSYVGAFWFLGSRWTLVSRELLDLLFCGSAQSRFHRASGTQDFGGRGITLNFLSLVKRLLTLPSW